MIECNGYASICVGGGTVWFVVIYHLCWPGGQVREFVFALDCLDGLRIIRVCWQVYPPGSRLGLFF